MADPQLVQFPDLKPVDPSLQPEQVDVMRSAVKDHGGLGPTEDLTALPSGSPPPGNGWTKENTIPGSTRNWDIYTRDESESQDGDAQTVTFPDEVITASPKSATSPGNHPGQAAQQDIDKNFSPSDSPDSTTEKCAAAFAEGLVEGAVTGYVLGSILAALGPVGLAIGIGMLFYGAYQLATNWSKMTPEQKAKAAGGILGGFAGGGLVGGEGAGGAGAGEGAAGAGEGAGAAGAGAGEGAAGAGEGAAASEGAVSPPLQAEGAGSTKISPQMENKILNGEVRNGRIVGGHSPRVGDSPWVDAEVTQVNPNGTKQGMILSDDGQGNLTNLKGSGSTPHTFFPDSWSDAKIIDATTQVGDTPPVETQTDSAGNVTATKHTSSVDGVEMTVVKDADGNVLASYPTGN